MAEALAELIHINLLQPVVAAASDGHYLRFIATEAGQPSSHTTHNTDT